MDGTKLKVQLIEVDETVERILEISKEYTFKQLHRALQTAMGWKDLEKYYFLTKEFVLSEVDYRIEGYEFIFSDQVKLGELKDKTFRYYYNGDLWKHTIEILEDTILENDYPQVLEYKGRCPMEEYGGPAVYNEMVRENISLLPVYDRDEVNHILEISLK